jgi:hypothetical protein
MHKKIDKAVDRLKAAQATLDQVVEEVQATCKHEDIRVAPYMPMKHMGNMPPYFVCANCGWHESGYYARSFFPNRIVSESECLRTTRDQAYDMRKGPQRNDPAEYN